MPQNNGNHVTFYGLMTQLNIFSVPEETAVALDKRYILVQTACSLFHSDGHQFVSDAS